MTDAQAADNPLRIALIAPPRFPIAEPFAGGLEAHVWHLAHALRARGHLVHLYGCTGSDDAEDSVRFEPPDWSDAEHERSDITLTPASQRRQDATFQRLMRHLVDGGARYDVVHNHSLDPAPLQWAGRLAAPMLTTLHTPPFVELTDVVGSSASEFAAVSGIVARAWKPWLSGAQVVHNGVDLRRWPLGRGGDDLVWFGRIVPEKAPHIAVEIARRAGRRITIIGRIGAPQYFDDQLAPLLDDPLVSYRGPLPQRDIARIAGSSAVTLTTPDWDEPFGLVAVESAACGTPVLALRRGGLVETVIEGITGYLADTIDHAAALTDRVAALDRSRVRRAASDRFGIARMVAAYEDCYYEMCDPRRIGRSA